MVKANGETLLDASLTLDDVRRKVLISPNELQEFSDEDIIGFFDTFGDILQDRIQAELDSVIDDMKWFLSQDNRPAYEAIKTELQKRRK